MYLRINLLLKLKRGEKMKKHQTTLIITVFLLGLVLMYPNNSVASGYDKGSGGIEEGRNSEMKGSSSKGVKATKAISGFCPVCLIDGGKVVKGKSSYTVEYEGKKYYFLGSEQKEKFLEDPEKYTENLEEKFEKAKSEPAKKGSGNQHKGSGYQKKGS